MIECNPQGICSFNYRLTGDGHQALLDFNWLGRGGSLQVDGRFYEIGQTGVFRSRWFLMDRGNTLCSARYPAVFSSEMEIQTPIAPIYLHRTSIFGRQMSIVGRGYDLVVTPAHPFTRRARINGRYENILPVAFAFWLTALQWRARQSAASSNSQPS